MRKIIFSIWIFCTVSVYGQQKLTLDYCQMKSRENHPLGLQKAELKQINQLNQKLISKTWLPQLQLNGQASYQSDVLDIGLDIPGFSFPTPSRDQYRLNLDVSQMIYDGGSSNLRQQLREVAHKSEIQETEVQLYQVVEQVNNFFFRYLILEENNKVLQLGADEIRQRIHVVRSAVRNGVMTESAQLILEAELLRLEQSMDEITYALLSVMEIMEILMGEPTSDKTLEIPDDIIPANQGNNRPELMLFSLQKQTLLSTSRLSATANRPRLGSFAQAGYGKPGFNMLKDEFDFFYIVGLRFTWNLWDWEINRNQRQILVVQSRLIDSRQSAFEQSQNIALASSSGKINQLKKTMERDIEIILIHEKILQSAASQLENGVITSTEYLTRLNALNQSKITYNTHRIELLKTVAEYNTLRGNM